MTPHETFVARRCAWLAAAVFAAGAVFAWAHLALGGSYPGFTSAFDVTEDLIVGIVWTLAALGMSMQLGRLAFFAVLGAWLAVIHGFLYGAAMFWPGLPFIAAGVVLVVLGAKAAPLFRDPPQRVSGLT